MNIELIKSKMYEYHINKSELSRRTGVPLSTITTAFSRNFDNVSLPVISKICKVLNISLDDLVNSRIHDREVLLFDTTTYTKQELQQIDDYASYLISKRGAKHD